MEAPLEAESWQQHLLIKAAAPGSGPCPLPGQGIGWGSGRLLALTALLSGLCQVSGVPQSPLAGPPFSEGSGCFSTPVHPPRPQACLLTLPSWGWTLNLNHPGCGHLLFFLLLFLFLLVFRGGRKLLCSNYCLWVPKASSSCSGVAWPGYSKSRKKSGSRKGRAGSPRVQRGSACFLGAAWERQQLGGLAHTPLAA